MQPGPGGFFQGLEDESSLSGWTLKFPGTADLFLPCLVCLQGWRALPSQARTTCAFLEQVRCFRGDTWGWISPGDDLSSDSSPESPPHLVRMTLNLDVETLGDAGRDCACAGQTRISWEWQGVAEQRPLPISPQFSAGTRGRGFVPPKGRCRYD